MPKNVQKCNYYFNSDIFSEQVKLTISGQPRLGPLQGRRTLRGWVVEGSRGRSRSSIPEKRPPDRGGEAQELTSVRLKPPKVRGGHTEAHGQARESRLLLLLHIRGLALLWVGGVLHLVLLLAVSRLASLRLLGRLYFTYNKNTG